MIATGLTRRVSRLGRIMIPIAIRNEYGIGAKDEVEIFTRDDLIVIQKYIPRNDEIQSRYSTDHEGRIVLPKSIRKEMQLTDGNDFVEIFTEQDCILLRKHERFCVICGEGEAYLTVKGKKICRNCAEEIRFLSEKY